MSLLTDLIAYYALDEASGNALDSFGSKALTDNGSVGAGTGKIGGARDYEQGSSQFHQRTDTAFSLIGDFTVSVWINAESVAGNDATHGAGVAMYSAGDTAGQWWVSVRSNGSVTGCHWTASGNQATGVSRTPAAVVTNGAWAHVVYRRSGSTYTVWVDGVSQTLTTGASSTLWGSRSFEIGRNFTSGTYRFDGLIDELGVWSRALTDPEIASLYNGGSGLAYSAFGGSAVAKILQQMMR